jgi:predicted metalloprotease with PDZ domain
LVALCLDLTLRNEGKTTLDEVMRGLWLRTQGGPMTEADLCSVLAELSGRSFAKEIAQWVHATTELPLRELLEAQGVAVLEEPAQMAQRLGLRVSESTGIHVKVVLRGGAAEEAGLASNDEWLGLEVGTGKTATQWRLSKLDDLALYAGHATKVGILVARDKRLLKLTLHLPKAVTTWRLAVRDAPSLSKWLGHAG